MSDEQKPNGETIPPKISLKKTGEIQGAVPAGIPSTPKKATSRIDLPPEVPPLVATRKTSLIIPPKDAAGSAAPVPGGQTPTVKTIRLTSQPPTKLFGGQPVSSAGAPQGAEDAKRQTARIPLQAALNATPADITVASQPKTIRIKRPGQAPTAPAAAPMATPAADRGAAPVTSAMALDTAKKKTARVELPEGQTETAAQPTQKKTIKLRRTEDGAQAIPKSVAVARLESQMAERYAAAAQAISVLYPILAAAALVVLLVLSYLLVAQAFPDLGWRFPGQVVG